MDSTKVAQDFLSGQLATDSLVKEHVHYPEQAVDYDGYVVGSFCLDCGEPTEDDPIDRSEY